MINCLEYALDFWNENNEYKIYYNSDHCINVPKNHEVHGFLPIESFGFGYFENWFIDKLIAKRTYKLLIKYFKTYQPDLPIFDITEVEKRPLIVGTSGNEGESYNIYCDGSCAVHSTKKGRWAFVVVDKNDGLVYEDGFTFDDTTNGEMEVNGLYQSLKYANDHLEGCNVTIHCDSSYVVQGYNEWCQGWKAKGWKKANKTTVKFSNVWVEIDKIRSPNIKVEWVKAHADNKWNNYVDELTRKY